MKMNKDIQYGILFCLYLARSGRTTIDSASEGLKIKKLFLAQIANKLKNARVLDSFKGPHGGYELNGNPPLSEIIYAIAPQWVLNDTESKKYVSGSPEYRALYLLACDMSTSLMPVKRAGIRQLMQKSIDKEMNILNGKISEVTQ